MSELPNSWTTFTLKDIGGTVGGKTPSKSNSAFWSARDLHWTSPKDMKSFRLTSSEDMISKLAVRDGGMRVLPKGSVLVVTRSGILAHTLPVAIADIETTINQDIKAIPPNGVVEPRYLAYVLRSKQQEILEKCSKEGTTVASIQTELLESLPLPLAPPAEQKRIADKLDRLLAAVDTCKARLDAIPNILKRFRQSVLAAGTCGVFTRNFRPRAIGRVSPVVIGPHDQSEDIPSGWRWELLKNLARLESGHTPRKSVAEYWEGGDVPWISLRDIRAAHGKIITQTESMPTMLGINNSSARLLPAGTVCFSRDISVGFTTIMGREMATTQHFANWICGDSLNNKYLMFALMAAAHHLTISGQGTTVKTIYMPALEDFRVLLPPLLEQVEIVAVIESLLGIADELEARLKCASSRIRGIAGSTLAKAFKGQLCATDSDGARTVAAFKACAGAV